MDAKLGLIHNSIENKICLIRDCQVIIDSDLAELYQIETKVLNQAVKRNINRFPESFRFELTSEEYLDYINLRNSQSHLKSQTVTSNKHGGRRFLPAVFTEQGVAMLSAVLRSETAVQVSIEIMQTFVQMRKFMLRYQSVSNKIEQIERKQIETELKFEKVFQALESKDKIPSEGVFFDGQIFDAYELVSKLIRTANKSILLIDNYLDETVLSLLSKKKKNVSVKLFTKNINKQLLLDVSKANEQFPFIELHRFDKSHDRFLIIDQTEVYHIGASLKDLGKRWFAFSKLEKSTVNDLLKTLNEQ